MLKPRLARPLSLLAGPILLAGGLCVFWAGPTPDTQVMAAPPDARGATLYDPDPKHLWNRLHQAFHIRETFRDGDRDVPGSGEHAFDPNDLDPFLWDRRSYLLTGPAHKEALALLEEFLDKRGERLVTDPLKRALLQRDLWALFDWVADPAWANSDGAKRFREERRELQSRLAHVLPRLALSTKEIEKLPHNYADAVKAKGFPAEFQPDQRAAAFLPADLWQPDGPWVLLGDSEGGPLAERHVHFFGGRSSFLVFLRLPEGRAQTLTYLEQLRAWRHKGAKGDVPQFPANAQTALVRRTLLLDDQGAIRPTPLTEQVQLRVLHDPTTFGRRGVQTFLEFRLRREQLLAGKAGGLSAVPGDEGEWDHLSFLGTGHGIIQPIMASCRHCHDLPGVLSMNSFEKSSFRRSKGGWSVTSPGDEERRIAAWKREQYSWGLLEGIRGSAPGK